MNKLPLPPKLIGLLLILTACAHAGGGSVDGNTGQDPSQDDANASERQYCENIAEHTEPPAYCEKYGVEYHSRETMTTLLVTRSTSRLEAGDTLTAKESDWLGRDRSPRQVEVWKNDKRIGDVPAVNLGPANGGKMYVTAESGLNLRECPSTECSIVRTLRNGKRIQVGEYEDGWYAVVEKEQEPSVTGYIAARYLESFSARRHAAFATFEEKFSEFVAQSGYPGPTGSHVTRLTPSGLEIKFLVDEWSGYWARLGCDVLSGISPNLGKFVRRIPGESSWRVVIEYQTPTMRRAVDVAETSSQMNHVSCRPPF